MCVEMKRKVHVTENPKRKNVLKDQKNRRSQVVGSKTLRTRNQEPGDINARKLNNYGAN